MASMERASSDGSGQPSPDDPVPWALFRYAHDAFRTALNEMEYLLTQEETWRKESFPTLWARYQKFAQLHSDMEDYGLFPLLDKISNKAFSQNGFWEEHQNEVTSAIKVDRAIDVGRQSGNWNKVLDAYRVWQKQHIQHLEHEEEIWENYLDKFGVSVQERCQLINQEVITPMDQHDHNLCLQFYSWIVRYLSTFGSIQQSPKDATITFVRGLRSVCSAQQWARFMPAVHAVCDDSVWQYLLTNYNIHSADPIASQLFGSGYVTSDHSNVPSGRATPADAEHRPSDGNRTKELPKPTRASFLYTLSHPTFRVFASFYGAELEPPILHSSDFPTVPHTDSNASINDSKTPQATGVKDASDLTHTGPTPMTRSKSGSIKKTKPIAARSIVASKAIQSSMWSRASSRRPQNYNSGVWCCFSADATIEDENEDPLPPSPRVILNPPVSDAVEIFEAPEGSSTKKIPSRR